ncbi:MAG: FxsA family protein [Alphaproteobacteria bacterium]|nr:FxsA family protein [Alphaproteobacteria bacterium]
MPLLILALFIGVPLIEIYLFIVVGGSIGVWATIGLVILTALIGTALLRHQGLATLARAQAEMQEDRLPVRELFTGVCLLFGGALLLTPGFLTDAIGFALLVPQLREIIGRGLWRVFEGSRGVHFSVSGTGPNPRGPGGPRPGGPGGRRGPVIDGDEFGVERDDPPPANDPGEPPRQLGNRR